MSDEPQQPPQPPQVPVPVPRPCMNCGKEMNYMMPPPKVFNAIDVSVITLVHNKPDICPHCRAMFLPVVEGFDENGALMMKWMPVRGGRQPVIVGGGGDALKKAIEEANITEMMRNSGRG